MISRGTRQRSSWINVNDDVTTAARLNSARFQATIYSASCVSYSPPTCSSTVSRRYLLRVLFGDFSFPFFPSFLPSFSFPFPSPPSLPLFPFFISLLNRRASQSDRIRLAEWKYIGKSVYLSDQGPLSSRKPSFGGWYFPSSELMEFPLSTIAVTIARIFEFTITFFSPPPRIVIFRPHFVLQQKFFTIFLID